MNCWAVLELDANASLKDIKKSYAKKLKNNKPDENPEGFQRLNAAYQEACRIAKYQARQQAYDAQHELENTELEQEATLDPSALESSIVEPTTVEQATVEQTTVEQTTLEPPEDYQHQEHNIHASAFIEQADEVELITEQPEVVVPLIEKELSEASSEQKDIEDTYSEDDLTHDVETLMESDSLNNLAKWEPLLNSPLLYEIRFRGWFTLRLFYLVSYKLEAEKEQAKEAAENKEFQQTEPVLKQATLDFLNEKMMWTHQLDRLESHFDHDEMERVTQRLITKQRTANTHDINATKQDDEEVKNHASIFKRLAAFIIDNIIYVLGVHFIDKINGTMPESIVLSEDHLLIVYLLWLCILLPYMESTRLKASPGKWLVGIQVVSKKGKKLNYFHSLIRFILCIGNILGFKITVLINAFMYDGRLLHDRISFSKVVNRSNES